MSLRFHDEKTQPARFKGRNAKKQKVVYRVKSWVDDCKNYVETWRSNQVTWHKLRMRIKKKKTFPFPGCSNIRMPTAENKIRKEKAALMNVIFGIRPIVQVIPAPSGNWDVARKIEKFLDWLIVDKMKIKPKAIVAIDQELEKGFYLMKPYWKVDISTHVQELSPKELPDELFAYIKTGVLGQEEIVQYLIQILDIDMHDLVRKANEASLAKAVEEILGGSKKVKIAIQDVIYNAPDVSLCEPERVYVPSTSGYNPQDAQYIVHEFFLPLNTLKQNARHKGWDTKAVNKIEARRECDLKEIDTTKDEREGIERLQETASLVKIWECYCYYDIDGDGEPEKAVITLAPDFDVVLRQIALPFHSGKFPFVKLFYELTDDRWFAHRGIPELIEDIIKEIDVQHMQKIDSQTLRNAPMFIYRAGMVNPKTTQFVFGSGIPAQGMQPLDDIIKPFDANNPNVEFSYEREQMMLEAKIEELIGQPDYTLQSMINKREPRTASEVNFQQQSMNSIFSLDADMHRDCFAELFTWVYDLWSQYGDDEVEFKYFGNDVGSQGEDIKLTKEEIQGKYKITIRGNDQNTNPQLRLQKAQAIMQASLNPIALQTGVITPVHLANAYKRFYQELDIPNWEELLNVQPQPQQPSPAQMIPPQFGDLTDAEQAQILAGSGIQPDVEGRALRKESEEEEKEADKLGKLAKALEVGGKDEYAEGEQRAPREKPKAK